MHIAEAKRTLATEVPWLCDSMANDLKHALGNRPNSEFIVDPDGKLVVAREWSNPASLRADLEKLVGKVLNPTKIADLNMSPPPEPKRAPTGLVPRLELPTQLNAAIVKPAQTPTDSKPHYVKLRAELGRDSLYLGFYLDPLYKVHWNNEAPPMKCELIPPAGISLSKTEVKAEKFGHPADADPREFLLEFSGNSSEPIRAKLSYFACDDDETFCNRVEQEYLIYLQRDPDGGRRFGNRSGRGRGPRASRGGNPFPANSRLPRGQSDRRPGTNRQGTGRPGTSGVQGPALTTRANVDRFNQLLARFPLVRVLDSNNDGELSGAEQEIAARSLLRLDRNGDGKLTTEELTPRQR